MFAELRLRACVKIGEISRELEQAQGERSELADIGDRKSKQAQLEKAGINDRTANRYEELTGGREEQAQEIVATAAEPYFAKNQENNEAITYKGLRAAVLGGG